MHLIPKFIKYCQWHNGPEGWGLATPRNHIFSEAYHPSWPPCPSPYSPVQPSTAHQPFWCCQTCNHSFPLSNYIVYFLLFLMNISTSNNSTALSEHCCTPGSYQSSPPNNNEQVKHLATGINNDRTWWFFLAKHIYNDFPTDHEQPWKLTFLFVFAFAFERTVKVSHYLKYHWIDTSFPRLVEIKWLAHSIQFWSTTKLSLCDRPLLYPKIPKATTNS